MTLAVGRLRKKVNDFGTLPGFRINKQKAKMSVKNTAAYKHEILRKNHVLRWKRLNICKF